MKNDNRRFIVIDEIFCSSDAVYYHGGAPDLTEILPPSITKVKSCSMFGAKGIHNKEKIYITTDIEAATLWAALHPSRRGVVYRVKPIARISNDPDYNGPACVSCEVDAVKILQVYKLDFFVAQQYRRMALGGK